VPENCMFPYRKAKPSLTPCLALTRSHVINMLYYLHAIIPKYVSTANGSSIGSFITNIEFFGEIVKSRTIIYITYLIYRFIRTLLKEAIMVHYTTALESTYPPTFSRYLLLVSSSITKYVYSAENHKPVSACFISMRSW
jgi:hypothetical protein